MDSPVRIRVRKLRSTSRLANGVHLVLLHKACQFERASQLKRLQTVVLEVEG
jgi:hypothetical protein